MQKRQDFDSPWKEILDAHFKEFLEMFHPKAAAVIDWGKRYESLDNELRAMHRRAKFGQRRVDKLIKVWLKNGQETWILLHFEVKNFYERKYEVKTYVYNYRLFDRFGKPVVTIVILADASKKWRPQQYRHELLGCEIIFNFFTVKFMDYLKDYHTLLHHKNPFAVVILAQLDAIRTYKNPSLRLNIKLNLTKSLYRRGLNKQQILNIYRFIDWILTLPEHLELEYHKKLEQLEEKEGMPYITTSERVGIAKGIEQGMQEGEYRILKHQLQQKFKKVPSIYLEKLATANEKQLIAWAKRLLHAKSLGDIFGAIE